MPRCIKLALICLSIIPFLAQAQKNPFYVPRNLPDKDSLKSILQNPKDSIQKLTALRELGHAYYENRRDSALYFFEQSITTARNIKSKLWEADASNSIGFVSYIQGNYPRALQFLTQGVTLAEDPNSEKGEWKSQASGFVSPGIARLSILARGYQHLAVLYGYTGNYSENTEKELYYFDKALAISTSLGDKAMMGIINMNKARHYSFGPHLDSSIYYQQKALQLMNEAGYKRYIGSLMFNLGEAYRRHQQPENAKSCYWFGMQAGKNIDNVRSVADNALALANVHLSQLNTDSAIFYAHIAEGRYKSTMILSGTADSYAMLSAAFQAKKMIDSAFHFQGLSLATRKELDADEKVRRFQQINFDEQMKAQEAADKERRARNRIITLVLLGGLAILAFIGIFLYRNNIARKRANDLLAEKNRDLEIESALEKVRSRSLAMHKSDELQDVTNTVFEQMRALKIEAQTITIFITIEGSRDYNCWLQNDEQNYFNGMLFPYFPGNVVSEDHQMNAGDLESKTYTKDLKDEWFRYMFTQSEMRKIPESRKQYVLNAEYFTASAAGMNYTKIGMYRYSDKAFTTQEYKILKRFAQVFEQAYIRFLDLQKAEAQARDAQIEVAMEKVRSRTMAMHKSEELKEVIQVVYEQFLHLNMHVEHAGFIVDYKSRDDMHIWLADPNRVPSEVFIPYFDSPHWNSFLEAKAQRKDLFTNLLNFEEKNKFYQGLFDFFPIPEDAKDFYFNCPGLAISTVLLDNVGLYIENFSGKSYTDEENTVLMRFGKVFQQTYTRFLDLQKAEAQARESQIEAALERVRAQTMAMHSSTDLGNVASVMFEQMRMLGGDLFAFGIVLCNKYDGMVEQWHGLPGSSGMMSPFLVPVDLDYIHRYRYDQWKAGVELFSIEIPEHYIARHFELMLALPSVKAEIERMVSNGLVLNIPTWEIDYGASFKYGYLLVSSLRPYAEDKIFPRFAKVFEQAYTRFLDLQKAEAQAREAQIEAALERIRSRSMAMHKSEELADLSLEVVKQVQILGVPTWFCAFNIYDDDPRGSVEWGSNGQGTFAQYRTPREGVFKRYYDAGKRGESLLINEIGKDECPAHYEYLCSLPGVGEQLLTMKAAGIPFPTYQIDHVAFFKYGYILFITYEPVPETHEIFKRFAKVFEQSYTRFLDLQKAEAQAKEAHIEAALERVRSRSLAMHHTEELQDVVNVAAQQLLKMDIDIDGGMFIAINDEVKDNLPFWAAAGAADYVQKVLLPFLDRPTFTGLRDAILRREPLYTEYYSKAEKDEFMNHMFQYPPWNQNSDEKKQELLARDGGYARSLVVNRYTCIGITNHHGKVFSDEDNKVLKRFGAVLEQSYTRFLDLQKAEAQAREARIEAALEKVRSRTMSMQKSDELAETASVMFRQLISLGIEPNRLYIIIIKEESGEMEAWVTDEDGSRVSTGFTGNLNSNHSLYKMYEGWKKQLKTLIIDMHGEELQNYFHYLHDVLNVPFKGGLEQKRRVQHVAYFSKGLIGMASPELQPAETLQLLERFAAVFNLTFTRFNDLKIAEAHALQAELDLIAIKEAKKRAEEALTELQAAQKQLIQAEKMASLGELTAGIAHEIQNPLNFVNNFSEINKELIEEVKSQKSNVKNEELEDLLNDIFQNNEKINHHGKRADAIVKGMLQHTRSGSGTKELTDINAICEEYLRLAYHGFRAKDKSFNSEFNFTADPDLGKINVVPQEIGRVILNLISNAFYAVNEKTKRSVPGYQPAVKVSTCKENGNVVIAVADNGTGMPQKVVDKIFQPFFTTKPTGEGTGLGLSLSYDIVKAHGGDLKVETIEGEGTEFIIQLPIG